MLRTGGSGPHARVLTDHDVLAGTAPSGTLPETGEDPVLVEPGDVVVPVLGGGGVARVIDEETAGAALGRNLTLLRPDPAALDAWFVAGFLRGTANSRQASSYASTATRLDVRRLQLPRLPWTSNAATANGSAPWPPSRPPSARRAASANAWCAACTTD